MSDRIWWPLWNKHEALYDYLQSLNMQLTPAQRPDHEGAIKNAELEIMRIEAVMDVLDGGRRIALPTDQQITDLQEATGRLQQAVEAGARVNELIDAANDVISTWPVSQAEV